jgi:hypothetical protein
MNNSETGQIICATLVYDRGSIISQGAKTGLFNNGTGHIASHLGITYLLHILDMNLCFKYFLCFLNKIIKQVLLLSIVKFINPFLSELCSFVSYLKEIHS